MNALARILAARIEQEGPLTIAQFMAAALHDPVHGYYATRPALGAAGDFITAPETSQMFGEMVGLWALQSWLDLGAPAPVNLIELGPGRGVMMADICRAAGALPAFGAAARIILCETSPVLQAIQRETLRPLGGAPTWIAAVDEAPPGPALIVANEFLDCLPIRQFVRTAADWREKLVGLRRGALAFGLSGAPLANDAMIPAPLRGAGEGAIAEIAPALPAFVAALAARLEAAPGSALFFDYGAAQTLGGDTLQAVRSHASADPLAAPGEADLTAHVDFAHLASLARAHGLNVCGPTAQGAWLGALGIGTRAAALQAARPHKADLLARQLARLTAADQMGVLFQALCVTSPGIALAAGFAAAPAGEKET